jgi:hypothetical protein
MNFKPTVMKGMWSFILTIVLYVLVYFSILPALFSNIFVACKLNTLTNKCAFTFIGTWLGFYIILSLFQRKGFSNVNRRMPIIR